MPLTGQPFHGPEAFAELRGGAMQGCLGVEVQLAGEIDHGEKQVTEFVLETPGVTGLQLGRATQGSPGARG